MNQSARSTVAFVDPGAGDSRLSSPDIPQPTRDDLSSRNWRTYAARRYSNPQMIGDEEFEQDLKRLKYVKKAITRYRTTGELCERLVLNHIIVMSNVFGNEATCRLIFLRMPEYLDVLKPFLVMLRILPPVIVVDGITHVTDDIRMDQRVVETLRRI